MFIVWDVNLHYKYMHVSET